MRKYIIGGLVGFLLAVPFTAFGEQITNIGKKVQAEYPVVVDGKQLDKKAIAIDGTTYAPLRTIAGATGYDVAFESKTVTFESQTIAPTGGETVEPTPTTEPVETAAPTPTVSSIEEQIKALEIEAFKAVSEKGFIMGKNGADKQLSPEDQKRMDELNATLKEISEQIKALKAQQ